MEGWKKDKRKEVIITDVEGIEPKDHLTQSTPVLFAKRVTTEAHLYN